MATLNFTSKLHYEAIRSIHVEASRGVEGGDALSIVTPARGAYALASEHVNRFRFSLPIEGVEVVLPSGRRLTLRVGDVLDVEALCGSPAEAVVTMSYSDSGVKIVVELRGCGAAPT